MIRKETIEVIKHKYERLTRFGRALTFCTAYKTDFLLYCLFCAPSNRVDIVNKRTIIICTNLHANYFYTRDVESIFYSGEHATISLQMS